MSVWFSSISFVDDNVAPQCQEFGLAYKDIKKVFFLMQNITEQRKQLYEPSTPGCTPQQLAQHMLTSLRLVFFFFFIFVECVHFVESVQPLKLSSQSGSQ